jgi:hypothetical protein
MKKYAPLKPSLFVASILGFFVSAVYILKFSQTWAITLALVFMLMIIACLMSMSHQDQLDEQPRKRTARKKPTNKKSRSKKAKKSVKKAPARKKATKKKAASKKSAKKSSRKKTAKKSTRKRR